MPSNELSEWIAYYRIEPMPDDWLRTGIECATIANVQGGKTTPKDFIPIPTKEKVDVIASNRAKLGAMASRR